MKVYQYVRLCNILYYSFLTQRGFSKHKYQGIFWRERYVVDVYKQSCTLNTVYGAQTAPNPSSVMSLVFTDLRRSRSKYSKKYRRIFSQNTAVHQ